MNPHITLVGGGLYPQRHLTLEGLEAIKSAEVTFHTYFPGATEWLAATGAKSSRDLSELYRDDSNDLDNYARMTEMVIEAARTHGHVAYLELGHPCMGVSATQTILDKSRDPAQRLDVTVMPGISSMDTIMVDARLDPLERGCLVVDSNRLLLFQFTLDPRLGLLIYHPSAVGTSATNYSRPWETNQLSLLANYLITALGGDRSFVAIRSATSDQHHAQILEGPLTDLADRVNEIDYGTTLYVPPPPPSGIDRNFLKLLLKPAYRSSARSRPVHRPVQ